MIPAPLALSLLLALGEVFFARTTHAPASLMACLAELVAFAGLGLALSRRNTGDWRTSLIWLPMMVWVATTAWMQQGSWAVATVLVGLGVTVEFARVLDPAVRRLSPWLTVPLLAVFGLVASRWTSLALWKASYPNQRIAEQLTMPVRHAAVAASPAVEGGPIILLTVDALRYDSATQMEAWKRLTARGASWERAMATASWTVPSVASMWTGALPADHGAGRIPDVPNAFTDILPEVPHLADSLRSRGWRTSAFVVNPLLARAMGFDRGFDIWSNPSDLPPQPLALSGVRGPDRRDARWSVDHAIAEVNRAPESGWLMWLHLFDPHTPYDHLPAGHATGPITSREDLWTVPEDQRSAAREAYELEVAYTDGELLRFIEHLDSTDFWSTGTLIFTSDHGEEFWDHGMAEHGHSHHGEVVDVALVVVSPGLAPGPRGGVPSLVDVHGTLAALTGLPSNGLDLREPLPKDRIAVSAGNLYRRDQRSARGGSLRAIVTSNDLGLEREVYDLVLDPGEHHVLPDGMAPDLLRAATSVSTAAEGREAVQMNDGALRALGYVE